MDLGMEIFHAIGRSLQANRASARELTNVALTPLATLQELDPSAQVNVQTVAAAMQQFANMGFLSARPDGDGGDPGSRCYNATASGIRQWKLQGQTFI